MRRARRVTAFVTVAVVAVAVCVATAGAGRLQPIAQAPSAESGQMTNETPKFWFVEFPGAPLAEGRSDSAVEQDDKQFRDEAQTENVKFKQRFRFRSLWNGISIEAKPATISRIREFGSVKAVYPVGTYAIPKPQTISPDLATAIQMTGADIAQNELGLTGRGVKVAVMDTGIDWQNPDLGGAFGRGARVVTGWDFVGDTFNADPTDPAYQPVPSPDPNPDDCNGHGTHVAGIVGADGEVTGVAPKVKFGAYRVFGCEGSTTDEVLLQAMERVVRDDVDVLNVSIGEDFNNWPGSPTAEAADRLVKKGVVVVASAGNAGANGLWSAGAPSVGESVISVASFDNVEAQTKYFTVNGTNIGYAAMDFSEDAPTSGSEDIVYVGRGCVDADPAAAGDQTDTYLADPDDKSALIVRGACSFAEKAARAIAAGATSVVVYNNVAGILFGTLGAPLGSDVPVVGISQADGVFIRSQTAPVSLTWQEGTNRFPTPSGGLVSSFSSYGLAADLSLKPDIGAPGGFIWSTYPLEKGGHALLSGTSMASPHVAGAVALLLESRGDLRRKHYRDDGKDESWRKRDDDDRNNLRASEIRDILQNSADPKDFYLAPGEGYLEPVHRQGAGMLDVVGSVEATTSVTPGKLSLGEGIDPIHQRIRIRNTGRFDVTYDLSSAPALSTGPNTFDLEWWDSYAAVSFESPSTTVPSGGSRTFDVAITPPSDLPANSLYGGYIVLTPRTGKDEPLRVPYAGFKGDYQSISVLNNEFGAPFLLDQDGNDHPAPFTLAGPAEQPNIWYHMDHQARRLTVHVVDARGRTLGRAFEIEYHPRNSAPDTFFTLAWDGTYMLGRSGRRTREAPDGNYVLVLTVEKPLADRRNPAHFETWPSPVFTIDRP